MVVMMSQGASRLIAMGTKARAKRPHHYRCLLGQGSAPEDTWFAGQVALFEALSVPPQASHALVGLQHPRQLNSRLSNSDMWSLPLIVGCGRLPQPAVSLMASNNVWHGAWSEVPVAS